MPTPVTPCHCGALCMRDWDEDEPCWGEVTPYDDDLWAEAVVRENEARARLQTVARTM